MSLRIIFAGTPLFSVPTLQALIDTDYEVVAVYTQPDRPSGRGKKVQMSPVKTLALEYDIPVIQPVSLRDSNAQKEFVDFHADLMVVVAYGLILPKPILEAPKYGCLNIHASILPRWRGAAPIHRAIEAGDHETGVAIMQMDSGLDTGDIWSEARMNIPSGMTTGELHDRLQILGTKLLLKTIPKVVYGQTQPNIQSNEGITYAEKIKKEEAHLDWAQSAEVLMRKICAFNPTPGAYAYYDDQLIKIWKALFSEEISDLKAGTLLVKNKRLFVVTGDQQLLEIIDIQPAGRKRMSIDQFLQGHSVHHKVLN